MSVLKNQKHERFAQLVARGESAGSSYRKVYSAKASTCETEGPALLRKSQVAGRVEELKAAAAQKVQWSIAERLEFLKEAALTPPDEVEIGSRICQGRKVTQFGDYLIIPDKIRAMVEYGRLAGDYKERVEHDVSDALANVMKSIRGKRDSAA